MSCSSQLQVPGSSNSSSSSSSSYLVGGAWGGALDVRQGENAGLAGDEKGTGELRMEAQKAGPGPEGHRVEQPGTCPHIKDLQHKCVLPPAV